MNTFSVAMTDSALAEALFYRLEQRRKGLKITQQTLAERTGITPKTYRSLKAGSCSMLVLIAVLRELQLLENLDLLVPAAQVRPEEVWSKLNHKHPSTPRTGSRRAQEAKAILAARKKIKTGE
ncbi:helix-turn-helix transcriptional regulator [Siccibacter colletis]|uniref:helix-turn-helix transcriptional regulator n=1 Tax=Siccibacter colletis TaxID=1505757 RepID=UPI0028BD349E|nr:helix-turn-helix transcriptional regulator [Siccibacter colletis]WNN47961.1 helix-turn-helix transcriptional regulator [Siccibacter colletis]